MSQQNDYGPYYSNGDTGGGGGYLAGGSPQGSASGSPGGYGRRSEAAQSLRPVTVKQLLEATQSHTDAEWMLDGSEIGQITIVAQVVSIASQATSCVYWIDDGNGRIEARRWVDSMNQEDGDGGISENSYIRVNGTLKTFGAKRYINATHIRPIKHYHEVMHHLASVMVLLRILEKGPPPGPGQAQQTVSVSSTHGTSAYNTQPAPAVQDQFANFPALQREILKFMTSQPPNDEGIHVAAIARTVSGGGNSHAISEALDKLLDGGFVYSTIDDSHYNVSL